MIENGLILESFMVHLYIPKNKVEFSTTPPPLEIKNIHCNISDYSDFIGCFEDFKNNGSSMRNTHDMSPCFCIGYCDSKGFSLAAIGGNYG